MTRNKVVAVAGATGAVGLEMIKVLEERNFPLERLVLLASPRSEGRKIDFKGRPHRVEVLSGNSFEGVDIALFSAGSDISREFLPAVQKHNCVMVDNSSAFRMDKDVPLVVPEVNPEDVKKHNGVIANPNCSTIQMVVALKPLYDVSRIKRVIVSTYQAISGAGLKCLKAMYDESKAVLENKIFESQMFPHQLAFNCLPQIPHSNAFLENGYTSEEMKMVDETKKIMGDDNILVSPTTVRIPVDRGHSEALNIEFEKRISPDEAREILSKAPGVEVIDRPEMEEYPHAVMCKDKDPVYVGRIRDDVSNPNALNMWVVSDNLRKGAALNAVQIAELL